MQGRRGMQFKSDLSLRFVALMSTVLGCHSQVGSWPARSSPFCDSSKYSLRSLLPPPLPHLLFVSSYGVLESVHVEEAQCSGD